MDILIGLVGMALVAGLMTAPIMAYGGFGGAADRILGMADPPAFVAVVVQPAPPSLPPVMMSSR